MALELSGKIKAARVSLFYYLSVGAGRRLVGWAVFLTGLLAVTVAFASGYWKEASSPGPVHSVHATWKNDCSICHAGTLTPTSSGNGLHFLLGQRTASDGLCQKCHMGPPHADKQIASEVETCAACHREHKGRAAFLSRVPDAKCTCCHTNLDAHTQGGKSAFHAQINRFDKDHPEFRITVDKQRKTIGDKDTRDPGRLAFNHQLHMAEGLEVDWTLGDIDKALRDGYRQQQPSDKRGDKNHVKLSCGSCHQLDSSDEPGGKGPARAAGMYMLPVKYEQHCKACHPLTFSASLPEVPIPHGLQPVDVRRFLRGALTERKEQEIKKAQKDKKGWPLPGKNLSREEMKREAGKQVEEALGEEEDVLFAADDVAVALYVFLGRATCGECHFYEKPKKGSLPQKVQPVNVPEVWYPYAKFSHRAHRGVDCLSCHAGAETSSVKNDVLIPGIDNCKTCHSAPRTQGDIKLGGVRQECVTCHNYHHDDKPLSGRGAAARGAELRRSLEQFLKAK